MVLRVGSIILENNLGFSIEVETKNHKKRKKRGEEP